MSGEDNCILGKYFYPVLLSSSCVTIKSLTISKKTVEFYLCTVQIW